MPVIERLTGREILTAADAPRWKLHARYAVAFRRPLPSLPAHPLGQPKLWSFATAIRIDIEGLGAEKPRATSADQFTMRRKDTSSTSRLISTGF